MGEPGEQETKDAEGAQRDAEAQDFLSQPGKKTEKIASAVRALRMHGIENPLQDPHVSNKLTPEEIAVIRKYAEIAGGAAGDEVMERSKDNPVHRWQEAIRKTLGETVLSKQDRRILENAQEELSNAVRIWTLLVEEQEALRRQRGQQLPPRQTIIEELVKKEKIGRFVEIGHFLHPDNVKQFGFDFRKWKRPSFSRQTTQHLLFNAGVLDEDETLDSLKKLPFNYPKDAPFRYPPANYPVCLLEENGVRVLFNLEDRFREDKSGNEIDYLDLHFSPEGIAKSIPAI